MQKCVHRVQQIRVFDFNWHEYVVALQASFLQLHGIMSRFSAFLAFLRLISYD